MNTTAPLLRTPDQPVRRPVANLRPALRSARTWLRSALRALRYDDRPEIERFASPSDVAVRPYRQVVGSRC